MRKGNPALNVHEVLKRQAIGLHSQQATQFAARYRVSQSRTYHSCFAYSRRRLDDWLARTLPAPCAGLRLLDVGCGTGHHLSRLHAQGFDTAGVDGSPDMLEHAHGCSPESELRLGDVEDLPFPDASFDVVVCVEVLRYLPSPSRALAEMARVLKPHGVCIATAAPLFSLNAYAVVNRLVGLVPVGNLVRLKQYFHTSGKLRRYFRAAHFQEIVVHGVYLGPVNWLERLAPRALPRMLRLWEPIDAAASDVVLFRELCNMFLVKAVRSG
jgi:ubiquinone/menaquinone biosynthesis C-methylase UbiE